MNTLQAILASVPERGYVVSMNFADSTTELPKLDLPMLINVGAIALLIVISGLMIFIKCFLDPTLPDTTVKPGRIVVSVVVLAAVFRLWQISAFSYATWAAAVLGVSTTLAPLLAVVGLGFGSKWSLKYRLITLSGVVDLVLTLLLLSG